MKNVLILLLITYSFTSQAQYWDWAKGFGGPGMERAWDIAITNNDNIIVTGEFTDTLIIENHRVECAGESDVFICSFASDGKLKWLYTFGGTGQEIGLGVDADAAGNIYACGYFTGTITIEDQVFEAIGWDLFVIKLSANGQFEWVKSAYCTGSEIAYGLSVTPQGDVFVTGWYQDVLTFNENVDIPCYGASDIFVAKFNTYGEFQWAKHAGNESIDYGFKIAADDAGNCFVTGIADSGSIFDELVLEFGGVFIAKYNSAGEIQDINSALSAGVNSIDISPDGNNGYIGERFQGMASFGNISIESIEGSDDAYLSAFSENCTWQWATRAGGTASDKSRAVATDANGNAFYTGTFSGVFTIDNQEFVSGEAGDDIFVAALNNNGEYLWKIQGGGTYEEVATDIQTDSQGKTYIIGWFTGESTFGSYNLTASTSADANFFIACVNPTINTAPYFATEPVTQAVVNELYEYEIMVNDIDNEDIITIECYPQANWLNFQTNTAGIALLSGTPSTENIGTHTIEIIATDGLHTISQSFSIEVAAANSAPVFTSIPAQYITELDEIRYEITATDPDNDDIEFSLITSAAWLSFEDFGNGTALLTGIVPAQISQFSFELQLTDNRIEEPVLQTCTVAVGGTSIENFDYSQVEIYSQIEGENKIIYCNFGKNKINNATLKIFSIEGKLLQVFNIQDNKAEQRFIVNKNISAHEILIYHFKSDTFSTGGKL